MRYRVNRSDTGSKALKAYAESLGFVAHSEGGTVDCYLAFGDRIVAVEWKSKGGTLTPRQQRLLVRGFPIRFISSAQQISALRNELMDRRSTP